MIHIKKLNEMIGDKYYLYKGYHEAYISDRPVAGTTNNRPSEYRTFNDAYEAAEKLGVDILYSEGLRDEVCDFFGDRNYCDENPELFFNPDEPIRESRRANARGRAINEAKIASIEKNENEKPYYIIKRQYYKKGEYYWEDEGWTFNSVDEAMNHIKVNIGQGMRYSLPNFKIYMETPIQVVIGDPE